ATDPRPLSPPPPGEPFLEVHCRVKPGKSATGNDYSSRLHAITANRNATRANEDTINGCHHAAFFPSFSQAFQRLNYVSCGIKMLFESCRGADLHGPCASSV